MQPGIRAAQYTANIDVKRGAGGRKCAHRRQICMDNEVLRGAYVVRHGKYRAMRAAEGRTCAQTL